MDIPNVSNKMVDGSEAGNKAVEPITAKAVSVLENEYFYPEANGYQSIAIRASTKQDADAIYLVKRKPVNPEPQKVEHSNETNNE